MMLLFPVPARIIKSSEEMRRKLLWQGHKEKKGFHLIKWKFVATGKKNGGLGIKNVKLQSKALAMKCLWKYSDEDHTGAKYEAEDSWSLDDQGYDFTL